MNLSSVCSCHHIENGFDCGMESTNDLDNDDRCKAVSHEKLLFLKPYIKENSSNLSSFEEDFVGMNRI